MTTLLLKLFVADYQDTDRPAVRTAYGKLSGLVGIFCNLLLFAGKIIIGTLSGSVSITADAVNNLSDAGSSIVTLIGFRLSARPADDEHPYGHARIEYISGLAVAALILLVGAELAKSSFDKILHPEPVAFSAALVIVLLLSIAVKLWMALFNRTLGRRISSSALLATSADSRNDVISTLAVLLACVIGRYTNLMLDGYIGLLVALFILWSGIGIARETIAPLLGEAPDEELVSLVSTEITKHPEVLGIHDLMVHDYGPGQRFATVHVEMDAAVDPLASHDTIDNIERDMLQEHNIQLTIHYDPLVTNDPITSALQERVQGIVHTIDPRMSIHDFRVVRGPEHTNLIFDLVLPHEWMSRTSELKKRIDESLQSEHMRYYTVITFDQAAFNPGRA